ncbi:hypothetical protein LMG7974_01595 [Campylobacter majalis]|uniref:Helicase ATP-binding domain-containing protein n=1 Tax=Campylobacter majalis TaxID=2790656 RepID=A0ABM8Q9J1_9BACT|nr:SNF2-related protein [Campylobacter majalis]CAD7289518.1 hypothetical protein LMG7974_01595 [Campylobacter majalis]
MNDNFKTLLAIQQNGKFYGTLIENYDFSIEKIKGFHDEIFYSSLRYNSDFKEELERNFKESIKIQIEAFGGIEVFSESIDEYIPQIEARVIVDIDKNEILIYSKEKDIIISEKGVINERDSNSVGERAGNISESSKNARRNREREFEREPSADYNEQRNIGTEQRAGKTNNSQNVGDSRRFSKEFTKQYPNSGQEPENEPKTNNTTNSEYSSGLSQRVLQQQNTLGIERELSDTEFTRIDIRTRINDLLGSELANKIISDFISTLNGTRAREDRADPKEQNESESGTIDRDNREFGYRTDDKSEREYSGDDLESQEQFGDARGDVGRNREYSTDSQERDSRADEYDSGEFAGEYIADSTKLGESNSDDTRGIRIDNSGQEQFTINIEQSNNAIDDTNRQGDNEQFANVDLSTIGSEISNSTAEQEYNNESDRTENNVGDTGIFEFYNTAGYDGDRKTEDKDRSDESNSNQSDNQIAKAVDGQLSLDESENIEQQKGYFKTFLSYQFLTKYEAQSYKGLFDNFDITSKKERIEANYEALKTTQIILNDKNRPYPVATPEEQITLAKFSGYGGLKELFVEDRFLSQRSELKELVGEKNYTELSQTTDNAYYTPDELIKQMYFGLDELGVGKKEKIYALEPSCGIGKFISLAPDNFEFEAIEKDTITATIAKLLHPNVKIYNAGLENVDTYREYDVVIGNPPFGQDTIRDYKSRGNNQSIHNYFAIKASELVKEGGIVNFVTSSYFLDSQTSIHRSIMSENGNFISAFRLPSLVFRHTDVLTDVFYYNKLSEEEKEERLKFKKYDLLLLSSNEVRNFSNGQKINLNEYYDNNPENMIGQPSVRTNQFGEYILSLKAKLDDEWSNQLRDRIQDTHSYKDKLFKLNEPNYTTITDIPYGSMSESQFNYVNSLKNGNLFEFDDKFYVKDSDNVCHEAYFEDELSIDKIDLVAKNDIIETKKQNFIFKSYLNHAEFKLCQKIVAFRDLLKEVLDDEKTKPNSDDDNFIIDTKKQRLRNIRDEILKDTKTKFLNSNPRHKKDSNGKITMHNLQSIIDLDGIDSFRIYATENEVKDKKGNKTYVLSDILLKRVLFAKEISTANNPVEALAKSINDYGRFNIEAMKEYLPNISINEILTELTQKKLIFKSLTGNGYELASEFLSGNVKQKHTAIIDMIKNKKSFDDISLPLQDVANELEAYFAPRVSYQDLEINFGSNYVDIENYENFIRDTFFYNPNKIMVKIDYFQGTYIIDEFQTIDGELVKSSDMNDNAINIIVKNEEGNVKFDTRKMLELVINNQSLEVKRTIEKPDGTKKTIIEIAPTKQAMDNADVIRDLFESYCFNNEQVRESIEESYNNKINVFAGKVFQFDEYLKFDNLNKDITLRPHQKDVVYKGIMKNSLLLDHQVGAGKTLASIAIAMEQKRMGIIKKALILVPNHLTRQWADEFLRAYPSANILVGDKINSRKARKEFLYKARYGEFDAVIMKHSTFENMNVMQSYQKEIIEKEIENIEKMVSNKKGARLTQKDENNFELYLNKQIVKLKNKLEKKAKGKKFDNEIAFEDLGIDALFVDEAHTFKNLYISTNLQGVKGLPLTDSDRAMKMLCATRYCISNNYKLYFMTGTPVSNSISEFYIMQNYLQPEVLSELGLSFFDDWQKAFTKVTLGEELDSTGVNYKIVPRLAKFINVPELMNIYKQNVDIITNEDIENKIGRFVPSIKGGTPTNVIIPRSDEVANFIGVEDENGNYNKGSIIYRMDHLDSSKKTENVLSLTTEARKAALDYRLINPQSKLSGETKISRLVERAVAHYKDENYPKGTQLIFCDMGVSKQNSQKINVEEQSLSEYKSIEIIAQELSLDLVVNDDGEELYVKYQQNSDGAKTNKILKEYTIEELISEQGDKFDVYAEILKELVKAGISQKEIAFIGDANTDLAKQALFEKMNAGEIRFLIGSTSKMGAGTNVQRLGVAMHELDCPWRPCDLQQRLGRFIRQGNYWFEKDKNFEMSVYRYATEQTYDARMFQVNEQKLKPLAQIKKGNFSDGIRVFDSIDAEVANIAEMKAFATGNMFVLEKHRISNFLQTEDRLFRNHKNAILTNQKNLKTNQAYLNELKEETKFLQNIVNIKINENENYSIKAFGIETTRRAKNKDDELDFKAKKDKILDLLYNFTRKQEEQELEILELKGITLTLQSRKSGFDDGITYINGFLSDGDGNTFSPQNLIYSKQKNSLFVEISYEGLLQKIENVIKNSENIFSHRNKVLRETEDKIKLYSRFLENNASDSLEDYNRGVLLKVLKQDLKNIEEIFRIRNEKRKESILINDFSDHNIAHLAPQYSKFLNKNGKLEPKEIVNDIKDTEVISLDEPILEIQQDQAQESKQEQQSKQEEAMQTQEKLLVLDEITAENKIEPLKINLKDFNSNDIADKIDIMFENMQIMENSKDKRAKNILSSKKF